MINFFRINNLLLSFISLFVLFSISTFACDQRNDQHDHAAAKNRTLIYVKAFLDKRSKAEINNLHTEVDKLNNKTNKTKFELHEIAKPDDLHMSLRHLESPYSLEDLNNYKTAAVGKFREDYLAAYNTVWDNNFKVVGTEIFSHGENAERTKPKAFLVLKLAAVSANSSLQNVLEEVPHLTLAKAARDNTEQMASLKTYKALIDKHLELRKEPLTLQFDGLHSNSGMWPLSSQYKKS